MRGYISLCKRRARTNAMVVVAAASLSSILLLITEMQVVSSFLINCGSSKRCVPSYYGTLSRHQLFQSKRSNNIDNNDGSGSSNNDYFDHLVSQFQGDFDNYNQVIRDRNHGLAPAEGGGYEHIHCVLCPAPALTITADNRRQQQQRTQQKEQWVLAAFYFNGNPKAIFRFRMYKLISPQLNDNDDGDRVRMKLHTLMPELEQQLRQHSDQPCTWWRETYQVWLNCTNNNVERVSNDEKFQSEGIDQIVSPLVGCDVLWDPKWDHEKHGYLYVDEYDNDYIRVSSSTASNATATRRSNQKENDDDEGLHATMEAGSKGAIVDSISLIPGKRILIKDELSLWKDEFWINDRGYDPDAIIDNDDDEDDAEYDDGDRRSSRMPFVYGNRRGIPYKLERVSCITSEKQEEDTLLLQRKISNHELAWTMGEDFRDQAMYEDKLHAVEEALALSDAHK